MDRIGIGGGDMIFFTWEFCWEVKLSPHRSRCKCHGKLHFLCLLFSPGWAPQSQGEPVGQSRACRLGYERGCGGFRKWSDRSLHMLTPAERSKKVLPYIAHYCFKIQANPFALSSTSSLTLQCFFLVSQNLQPISLIRCYQRHLLSDIWGWQGSLVASHAGPG